MFFTTRRIALKLHVIGYKVPKYSVVVNDLTKSKYIPSNMNSTLFCDSQRGGLANKLYGLLSAIVITRVTKFTLIYDDQSYKDLFDLRENVDDHYIKKQKNPVSYNNTEIIELWMQAKERTPYLDRSSYLKQVNNMKKKDIETFLNPKSNYILLTNCPFFFYFLHNPKNSLLLCRFGLLPKSALILPVENQVKILIRTIVKKYFIFNSNVITIKNNYLKRIQQINSSFIGVHLRTGDPLSDFTDYFTYLTANSLKSLVTYINQLDPTHKRPIFMTSDSYRAKQIIKRHLSNPIILFNQSLDFSSDEDIPKKSLNDNKQVQKYHIMSDILVLSYAQDFIGTDLSTYSTIIGLLNINNVMYLKKNGDICKTCYTWTDY